MAQKPINMNQIRRILQLTQTNTSNRNIAKQCRMSRNTVRSYKQRLLQSNLSITQLLELDDPKLNMMVHESFETGKAPDERFNSLEKLVPKLSTELSKTGVTKQLLWEEYLVDHPQGYGYTQFCHYLLLHQGQKETVMHFLHRMGEELMFDFAGKTMSYVDDNGEIIPCQIFVSVLPFSGYGYAEAVHSQKQEDLVRCMENALFYIGGVPQCMLSDNMKSCVTKPSRYEPTFTDLMEQFSVHYNTGVMATRIVKPRDKAAVESIVNTFYQRVHAPLRNEVFRSLRQLNLAILGRLTEHHQRRFRKGKKSRGEFFEQERLHLKPLSMSRLEIKQRVMAKVQKNYHVLQGEDYHFYSVPYNHVGKQVMIVYTALSVEIYLHHERIAIHRRSIQENGYSKSADHMPPNHRHYLTIKGYDADYFKSQADQISPEVLQVIEKVLKSRQFCQQAYNACLGILRLGTKYGNDRLIVACKLALQANKTSFGFINAILKNNTDKLIKTQPTLFTLPGNHENIRGAGEYQ
jgi:transposase